MSQQEADLYTCPSEGEHAFTRLMNFRVPAQAASGILLDTGIEYTLSDGSATYIQTTAKPIVSVYVFGPVIGVEGADGFQGHGKRDVYASVSLDDGTSWKTVNLSESTDKSSFVTSTPTLVAGDYCGEVPIDWNSDLVAVNSEDASMVAGLDVVDSAAAEALTDCDGEFCITAATWTDNPDTPGGTMFVDGFSPYSQTQVAIINPVTDELVFYIRSKTDGQIITTRPRNLDDDAVPCSIQAVVGEDMSNEFAVDGAPDNCVGPIEDPLGPVTYDYPGDNNNVFHAVAGNKILVAWQSRFCAAGSPAYAMEDAAKDEVASLLGIDRTVDLYLEDLFVVGGAQSSIDYETEGFPQVGEMPFNCLWTARGVLRENPEALGTSEVVWFKSERLTSGRRDLTRIETQCTVNGGCAITWQEDPVGLRPGEGEGPGTGWAGATTNSKTDIWYSFLLWEHFDIVDVDGSAANAVPLDMNVYDTKPGAFVPFAVPVRLTNNDRCTFPINPLDVSYCNEEIAGLYGIKNQCVDSVEVPLGPQAELTPICVVDANDSGTMDYGDLPNLANQAASRPRLNVKPRDADDDGVTDGAWVIVVHEEDKGLGRFGFWKDETWDGNLDDTATFCSDDPDADLTDNCLKADVGKNVFYLSFAMGTAKSSESEEGFGLLDNIAYQGAQINKPENNWRTGDLYPPMSTEDMWDFGDLNYVIMDTQIARRTALMSQSVAKAEDADSGLLAMPLFKEGIMNQGGPADIQAVRVALPCTTPGQGDGGAGQGEGGGVRCEMDQADANPYAPANLVCDNLWFEPGTADENPYYPNGLCMLSTINLSGLTPMTCEPSGDLSISDCPGDSNMTCEDDTEFGQLCMTDTDPEDQQLFPKLLEWYECPGSNGTGLSPECYTTPVSAMLDTNIDDQAWFMPLDVSKAHRGFLDGDFVLMMYAKSPNWKLNTVGNDRYELYQRRSFDGGLTYTTTPSNFLASNGETYSGSGTTTCETWRTGADLPSTEEVHNCTTYAEGEDEQSRNMSQLQSMRFTILDPRYSPTIASMVEMDLSAYGAIFTYVPDGASDVFAETDIRRPDRHHIVYETGDNTTVAIGEGEPLNLNYGRAFNFGDHFQVWYDEILSGDVIDTGTTCYPSDPHGDDTVDTDNIVGSGFCNEFDTLEGSQTALSEEASMTSSAAGDFLYAVWGQINLDQDLHHIDGNAEFRRVWWLDGWIDADAYDAVVGGGTQPQ